MMSGRSTSGGFPGAVETAGAVCNAGSEEGLATEDRRPEPLAISAAPSDVVEATLNSAAS